MPRPLSLLFTILALSLPGSRAAAAAPEAPARSHARPTAEAPPRHVAAASKARGATPRAPRARLAKDESKGHRPRAGDVGPRSPEKAREKAAPKAPASSVGHPNEGRLEGGVRLDTSRKDLRVVPAYAGADVRWGLPALVGMIERAARGVAKRFPGAVLDVGDLSRQRGGEVHRHNSHESGRDVDLGFYALDARGKQVHAPLFLRFDARLTSTNVPGARFDLPRNWLLVQHLLTDPRARVSHIFISDPLRSALIAHAKRIGVSRALIVRAQLAMMQPTGAEAHDDHMHVRISCPAAMRGSCIELAKNAPSHARARVARARKTDRALRTPSPSARAEAARTPKAAAAPATERAREAGASRREPAQPSRPDDRRAQREARRAAPRAGGAEALPLAAARAAEQQPMGGLDLSFLRPAASEVEIEADSDGADASGALDDSGALKITD
ncbi:penicillin-insensitive murein endopeptidase [Sorangium sp. So ce375]|uniref:penicillin-insensitive murein endopeptidase n=1 Tax=Sorangium sp. So ce375 TaxID=3133306 RepID=UPI003F5C04BF